MSLLVQMRCDAHACAAVTSPCETTAAATQEARLLTWLSTRVADETLWFCPLHQRFDPRLQRWVASWTRPAKRIEGAA